MKLLSVNVALPKAVDYSKQSIETGIFKQPVTGPVRVDKLNLEGDRQADLTVHGGVNKAVYAYSWKNVEYWKEFLQREDLHPGSFGENLTVDDAPDTEISIGDELEIGTARFMVTQPRFPCFKLGIAMGNPGFVKTFDQSGRNGFYLRVLEEGTIVTGDAIRRIRVKKTGSVTVSEFVKIYRARNAAGHETSSSEIRRLLEMGESPEFLISGLKGKQKR